MNIAGQHPRVVAGRASKDHHVKALPLWFAGYKDGSKTWSLRAMDRDYQAGDRLVLEEWLDGEYTGDVVVRPIIRVDQDFAYVVEEGYGILSLAPPTHPEDS